MPAPQSGEVAALSSVEPTSGAGMRSRLVEVRRRRERSSHGTSSGFGQARELHHFRKREQTEQVRQRAEAECGASPGARALGRKRGV